MGLLAANTRSHPRRAKNSLTFLSNKVSCSISLEQLFSASVGKSLKKKPIPNTRSELLADGEVQILCPNQGNIPGDESRAKFITRGSDSDAAGDYMK